MYLPGHILIYYFAAVAFQPFSTNGQVVLPKSIQCRRDKPKCFTIACNYLKAKKNTFDCTKGKADIDAQLGCQAPELKSCFDRIDVNKASSNTNTNYATLPKPAACRNTNWNKCFDAACRYLQGKSNSYNCNSGRSDIENQLKNCQGPLVTTCLDKINVNTNYDTLPKPAACRNNNWNKCFDAACRYLQGKSNTFNCNSKKTEIENQLRNCQGPLVTTCLDRINVNTDTNKFTGSAKCRKPQNEAQCIDFGCNEVRKRYNKDCNNEVRNWIRDTMKICHSPQIERCFDNMPDNIGRRSVPGPVISTSICRNNPEICMDHACNKMRKDYNRNCADWYFRNQVRNKLQSCYSSSVDLCMVNLNYEIAG